MLNKDGMRELAYLARIDAIEPIVGSDNCECAVVNGWHIMTRKGTFTAGDIGIYFEIDSKVDTTKPEFAFLASKGGKIKTQRYTFGGKGLMISQGLLMHPSDFGWTTAERENDTYSTMVVEKDGTVHCIDDDSRFLTSTLGVTYSTAEDNARKDKPDDKYKKMAQRHPKLFKKPFMRWVMKHNWGRKVMFFFFGKKKDKKNEWPSHIASKTDVERIQNMIFILNDKKPFVATEKVDGSSCSVMAERIKRNKIKYYICSRNVVFEDENQKCFYDKNIYFEAYNKYNLKEIITKILNDYNLPNVAIQMEVFGDGVQKRDYSLKNERQIRVFHIVSNGVKFPMDTVVEICEKYGLPHVKIVDDNYILPDTIEEVQQFVESEGSDIDGLPREGIVFYDKETGQQYFKFVSPNFLIKYHNG